MRYSKFNTIHIAWDITIRAWFSGLMLSKNTLLCSLLCSTWGCLAKTFLISATIFWINKIFQEAQTANAKQNQQKKEGDALTESLVTSKWLIPKYVLMRQCDFWLRFRTTLTVNLWFGIWTASLSSPRTIVGDHHPTC